MVEELFFNKKGIQMGRNIISDRGVFINGKKVAERYNTRNGIKYGALSTESSKREAQALIKRRREIHGNRYKHFTKKAGGRYIVYVGSSGRGN